VPKSWEDMSKEEKLAQLRSEIDSLARVTNGVARRIEEIRNELKSIESIADRERSGS
jgi:prefoldin subunit 5